jgi:hypothetical protein
MTVKNSAVSPRARVEVSRAWADATCLPLLTRKLPPDSGPFLRLPVRRELGALRPPPDGCRFEERIRDLERSLREERRALRQADTFYHRLAFRRFEPTLFAQPRVFPTKRKQLLVGSALDDTAVIKHENLICVHDSGKPVRDYDGSAVEH